MFTITKSKTPTQTRYKKKRNNKLKIKYEQKLLDTKRFLNDNNDKAYNNLTETIFRNSCDGVIEDNNNIKITIKDDGPGFPKDLIDKHKLGEPYIRSANEMYISKHGLGLGTFIGKTLLEKNFAVINFKNSSLDGGAEVNIKWKNKDLKNKI